jgi:hypothetical protein
MMILACESCEAEFQIKHSMDENYYKILYCPFCGVGLNEDLEDIMEWEDED